MTTPMPLNSFVAAFRFGCSDPGACTTLGKTATAVNKTKVTRAPLTLRFDIFISLKKISGDRAADTSTVLDPEPRVGGKLRAANFG
jgi:hypothetical protein